MKGGIQKRTEMKKGRLLAFEGIDGSGKSTQLMLLAERLKREGVPVYTTMEPTASPIGAMIRQVLTGRIKMDPKVIAALFVADRLDHLLNDVDGIRMKVEAGTTVLTDRYYFSSYAYQSVDMPMDWVIQANEESRKILRPTATVFIDVPPKMAIERIVKGRASRELFEEQSRLEAVRERYLEAFERTKDTETILWVDGTRPVDVVAEAVWEKLQAFF